MTAWTKAYFIAHSGPVVIYDGRQEWFMLIHCSIEYLAQLTHLLCVQFHAAPVPTLRHCLAEQQATFSGVRMNKKGLSPVSASQLLHRGL
jgi:hypothetical protein